MHVSAYASIVCVRAGACLRACMGVRISLAASVSQRGATHTLDGTLRYQSPPSLRRIPSHLLLLFFILLYYYLLTPS